MEGSALVDAVAALYQRAGYEVERPESADLQVDLLVTARLAGLRDVRVGIVCWTEHTKSAQVRAQERRIVQYRLEGRLDHVVIVSEGTRFAPPVDQQVGAVVRTFADLRRELLGFDDYLRAMARVAPSPGPSLDVFVGGGRQGFVAAAREWLGREPVEPLVLMGDAGSGKSHICSELVQAMATDPAVGSRGSPLPVLVQGGQLGRRNLLDVASLGARSTGLGQVALDEMAATGQLLLIIDDIDLAPRDDADHLAAEVAALAQSTPVILTTRRTGLMRWRTNVVMTVAPLTPEQTASIVRFEIGDGPSAAVLDRLQSDAALRRLATKPLLAVMMARILIEDPTAGTTELYVTLDQHLHGVGGVDLAHALGRLAVGDGEVTSVSAIPPADLVVLRRSSVVRTTKDGIEFTDPSFVAFYAARAVVDEIRTGSLELLARARLQPDAVAFAVDLLWDLEGDVRGLLQIATEDPNHPLLAENAAQLELAMAARITRTNPGIRIVRLHLERIKCFAQATFTFERSSERDVTLFLGDNGVGKSTVLQMIALCALGPDLATRLVGRPDQLVRAGASEGFATATFEISGLGADDDVRRVTVSLGVERRSRGFTLRESGPEASVDHQALLEARSDIDFMGLFVAGYGATRNFDLGDDSRTPIDDDPLVDRTASLFDPTKALIDPHQLSRLLIGDASAFRRLGGSALTHQSRAQLTSILRSLLPDESSHFTEDGDLVRGGDVVPLAELSDGYRSTLAWVGHLIVHLLAGSGWSAHLDQVRGIVLVDELDLHLHPQWQRVVVDRLTAAFPSVQFIGTTHSPLLAAGASPPTGTIARLIRTDEAVTIDADVPSVQGWRADQILASELFGYLVDGDPRTERLLAEAAQLGSRSDLDDSDRDRYAEIVREIDERLTLSGQTEYERRMEESEDAELDERIAARERELFGEGDQ